MQLIKSNSLSSTDMSKLAHYRILRKIGQGGMSVVYEALDERLKRRVAIKVLHPFLAEQKEYRLRFFREAEAVARLTHHNIVQIFDVANPNEESLYIVTELLVGTTLNDFALDFNLFELPELSSMIVWQLALALDHAHKQGIIHRDIKPENIMITNSGLVKLMDFGVASLSSDENITNSGTLLGSLAHMAPELIKGKRASIHSDIFSLATVYYWLVTGKKPFEQNTPHALLRAILDEPHPKVHLCSPFILDELAQIIEQGLLKDPKLRFSSAAFMADAIELALKMMGVDIEEKKLSAVLSKPQEEIPKLKEEIFKTIKEKIAFYQAKKQETRALSLMCRFSSNDQKIVPKTKLWPWGLLSLVAVLSIFVICYQLFSKEPQSSSLVKAEEVIPLVKKDETILSNISPNLLEEPQQASAVAAKKYELHLNIWPFARVLLDGKEVAANAKNLKLLLSPGMHKLSFMHQYAATMEKVIQVTEDQVLPPLAIVLEKSKPAFLIINSNIEADVALDGDYKGSSKATYQKPIVVAMPDKTHAITKELIVQSEGYEPFFIKQQFIAGETVKLDVLLKALDKTKPL